MITRIHTNRHVIAANRKTGAKNPVFTVSTYKGTRRGNVVRVMGTTCFFYQPDKPLPCGATAWAETTGDVLIDGK